MASSVPFTQLIQTVRTQADALLDRARSETADQIAQFSGRAASWADQAGAAAAEVSEETAATVGSAGRSAAETAAGTADRYARRTGDCLARVTGRSAHSLSEFLLRVGDALTEPRPPRD